MMDVAIVLGVITLCGCVVSPTPGYRLSADSKITVAAAKEIVRRELYRRGFGLSEKVEIEVRDSYVDYEFKRSRPIFAATVYSFPGGRRKALYDMNIDKESGKVEDFIDKKDVVPMHVSKP